MSNPATPMVWVQLREARLGLNPFTQLGPEKRREVSMVIMAEDESGVSISVNLTADEAKELRKALGQVLPEIVS